MSALSPSARSDQPWPHWMLRYVASGSTQAFSDLIWSVGGSPPYGGVSWDEASAVYELLESYQGAGSASPATYQAVEALVRSDEAKGLTLAMFRIHDSIASAPESFSASQVSEARALAARLQHPGAVAYFDLLDAQLCGNRGDIADAYELTAAAMRQFGALALEDPIYADRLQAASRNWMVYAVSDGHFDVVRATAAFYQAAGVSNNEVLTAIGPTPEFPDDPHVISQRGSDLLESGEPLQALEWFVEAENRFKAAGEERPLCGMLGDMAVAFNRSGNPQRATIVYEEAIQLCRKYGEDVHLSAWASNLGNRLAGADRDHEAEPYFREALEAALRSGKAHSVAVATENLARRLAQKERFAEAVEQLRKSAMLAAGNQTLLDIFRKNRSIVIQAWAQALWREGRPDEARRVIEETLNEADTTANDEVVDLLLLLAALQEKNNDLAGASRSVSRAEEAAEAAGDPERLDKVRRVRQALVRPEVRIETGEGAPAEVYQKALEVARRENDTEAEATARVNLVAKLLAESDPTALSVLRDTVSFVRAIGDQRRELILLLNGIDPNLRQGDVGEAQSMVQRAVELAKDSAPQYRILAHLYQAEVFEKGLKEYDLALESYRQVAAIARAEAAAGRSVSPKIQERMHYGLAGAAELALRQKDDRSAIEFAGIINPELADRMSQVPRPAPPEISLEKLRGTPNPELVDVLGRWSRTPTASGEAPEGIFYQMRSSATQLNWHEAAERLARVPAEDTSAAETVSPDTSALFELIQAAPRFHLDAGAALNLARRLTLSADELAGICLYTVAAGDRVQPGAPARAFWMSCRLAADPRIAGRLARISGMFSTGVPAAALDDYEFGQEALANGEDDSLRAELQNEAALCLHALHRTQEAIAYANSAFALARQIGAVETGVISRANLGLFLLGTRDFDAAASVLEETLPQAIALGNERLVDAIRHNLRVSLQALGREIPADLPFADSDPDALINEAVRSAREGDRDHAVGLFERAFRFAQRAAGPWAAEVAARQLYARVLYDLRQYDRAIEQMKKAAALAEERALSKEQVECYSWLASQRNRLGAAADAYAQKAVAVARRLGDPEALVSAAVALGSVCLSRGDRSGAADALREAARLSPADLGLRVQLGDVLAQCGLNEEALTTFASVLEQREAGTDAVMGALLGRAQIEQALGQGESALAHLRQACELARSTPCSAIVVEAFNRLGQALTAVNQLFEAADVLEEGVRVAQQGGVDERHILISYGNALRLLGETDVASRAFQRAREFDQTISDRRHEAIAIHALAGIALDRSEYDRARSLYLEAAALGAVLNDRALQAGALDTAGVTFTAQGRPERAIEYHLRAADLHEQIDDSYGAAIDCLNLAQAYVRVKEPQNATAALERYRRNLSAPGNKDFGDMFADAIEAQIYAQQGDWARAEAAFRTGIAQVEKLRASFAGPAEERRWVKRVSHIYDLAAIAAVECQQAERAIEFLEHNRVRFLERVRLRRNARPAGVDDAAWSAYLEAEEAFAKARARERLRLAEGTDAHEEEVAASRERLRHARAAVQAAAPTVAPQLPSFAGWDQLTAAIEPGEAAVLVTMLSGSLVVACASRDSDGKMTARSAIDETLTGSDLQTWVLGDIDKLQRGRDEDAERLYSEYLGLAALSIDRLPQHIVEAVTKRVCEQIGARLWPRILAILPKSAKRLILVPSAGFNVLPLHAARLEGGKYADECFEIRYVPSLKTLAQISEVAPSGALPWKLGQATNPTEDEALAFTIPEATLVARTYEEPSVQRLPGRRATLGRVLELLRSCETVHFAGHGFYDPAEPEESGLLCAMREGAPTVLTFATLLEQIGAVRTRLVALSGCETGLVQSMDRLNDFLGLSSALLTAGAATVVASLWRVDDAATAMLLSRFFQNLKAGGQSIPAALTAAQKWLREDVTVAAAIDQLAAWAELPLVDRQALDRWLRYLREAPDPQQLLFENPLYWAGFYVNGAARLA